MNEQTAIEKQEPQELAKKPVSLLQYMNQPEVIETFSAAVGSDQEAKRFVQSVIVLVQTDEPVVRNEQGAIISGQYSLQNCSHRSIAREALRAATLRVSVDKAERQAWLIARKNKKGVIEAALQFHYQEVENRAWRTNRFTHINVSPIYEGTEILENPMTGLLVIKMDNGIAINNQSAPLLRSINDRYNKKRIGWFGYYKQKNGREKTIYMTTDDIQNMLKSIPSWVPGSAWKNEHSKEIMEKKTVLLALLRQADTSAPGMDEVKSMLSKVEQAENPEQDEPEPEYLDAEIEEAPEELPAPSLDKQLSDLGFEPEAPKKTAPTPQPTEEPETDVRAKHAELWKKASKAGLINSETVNLWKIRHEDENEDVLAKIGMIAAALGEE